MKNGELVDARVINGDVHTGLTGRGDGLSAATMAGFPHFRHCTFTGEFPIAVVDFADDSFPGTIRLTAWNPLIPLNDKDSSIPAAFLEYTVTNTTAEALEYTVGAVMRNPYGGSINTYRNEGEVHALFLHGADSPDFGDMTVATDACGDVSYQQYWYRGGWHDGLERYWRNFTEQEL